MMDYDTSFVSCGLCSDLCDYSIRISLSFVSYQTIIMSAESIIIIMIATIVIAV